MVEQTLPVNLEESLQALEEWLTKLEQGDLPQEDTLQHEPGIALSPGCQQALQEAGQKIVLLDDTAQASQTDQEDDHVPA